MDLCHVLDSEMQWLRSQCLNSKIPQGVIRGPHLLTQPWVDKYSLTSDIKGNAHAHVCATNILCHASLQ